ncbi:MAG: glycosyltransferase family 4 protein [Leptolyngbya sp. SIO3F4]|nr:glycosyltransferase family 4 protein [Leptolyngbya sp. SIO3F4]
MRKLILLSGSTGALGGTLISISLFIKGAVKQGKGDYLCVPTRVGSLMEEYLTSAGQKQYLQFIKANSDREFIEKSLYWISQQPESWPLVLDNCIARELLPTLIKASLKLRFSKRRIYFFFHDLGMSYNPVGYFSRKLMFTCLGSIGITNSHFTASHVQKFVGNISTIVYPPVDIERFKPLDGPKKEAPAALQPILNSGARVLLTPSRLNKPGIVNDKNLRALIPVLAVLKQQGHFYHSVVIGKDTSTDSSHTRELLTAAAAAGVTDRFTILPPTFAIEDYYPYADALITLAPREPFGRTVVEAIACGIPVIGSCTGGISETLSNFAPQWTVDANNVPAVAATVISVVNGVDTPRLIDQGQQWVKENCNIQTFARTILSETGIIPTNPTTNRHTSFAT